MKQYFLLFFLLFWTTTTSLLAEPSSRIQGNHSTAEFRLVKTDETTLLNLKIRPEKGWYVVWKNSGDMGPGMVVDWENLPVSFTGNWIWPYPKRFDYKGSVKLGVDREVQLTQKANSTSNSAPIQESVRGFFQWMVCKEEQCVPETGFLHSEMIDPSHSEYSKIVEEIQKYSEDFHPQEKPKIWSASFQEKSNRFGLVLDTADSFPNGIQRIEFFPGDVDPMSSKSPVIRQSEKNKWEIDVSKIESVPSSDDLELLSALLLIDGKSYEVFFLKETSYFFFQALAFAFLGGLLLNLMPCVFPVLAMKAMSVVQSSKMEDKDKRKDSIFYSLGILSFFWILYLVFFAIRAGGSSLGWGFQLQDPSFLFFLAVLFLFMGFQMMGWIEFSVGVSGKMAKLTEKTGSMGSFFSGALAVIVATPCTAPFMGTALAYAFSEPAWVGLIIFTSLGIGMAIPIALIQNSPWFGRLIPKPGNWMVRFKEFLSFPLFLTAIWLLWVLAGISGRDSTFIAIGGLVFILMMVWVFKNSQRPVWKTLAVSFIVTGLIVLGFTLPRKSTGDSGLQNSGYLPDGFSETKKTSLFDSVSPNFGFEKPVVYSKENLSATLDTEYPVFLYFTADWCVTCKYNERTVFSTRKTERFFQDNKIIVVKADWTNEDPAITQALESFGRNGVPLYVYYPTGSRTSPRILPQMLTHDSLKSELN